MPATGPRTLGYLTLDAGPAETIDAAAAAGFRSVGVRITGRRRADPGYDVVGRPQVLASLRRRAEEEGVRLSNVSAYHLYADTADDDLARVMDAVVALGSPLVVANGYDPDESRFVERLARYAELGRAAGVRIAVEFMRYCAVKTIADAQRVVSRVGDGSVGILVDALHLARSGGSPDDVRRVDPSAIVMAQLCDAKAAGPAATDDELRHEARTGRLYPGDGILPLREFLDALPPGAEIEYEVPRRDLALLTLAERARVAYSVFETYLGAEPASSR